MKKKFLLQNVLFFTPIVLAFLGMEWLALKAPNSFEIKGELIEKEAHQFTTITLGSSQMLNAVNPEWMEVPTINLASGNQHHDTDFKLLKGLGSQLTNLSTVVLEVSYSHFELPHNGKDFWKNNLYLKYYHVNCFERTPYFKDRLVFLSNVPFFSERLYEYYIENKHTPNYNSHGYNFNDLYGQFAARNFDKKRIDAMKRFKINTEPNLLVFKNNTTLFFELLEYLKQENLQVVIATLPMYPTYLQKRNPKILHRRDSILQLAKKQFSNVTLFQKETDTLTYELKDFWNQSHLSPSGAKKYTASLDSLLSKMN
ncbi:MAG: hypothetical protein CL596_03140 [Alteromonas sp.]|nr:hypothetical protein [Alteromonas sp.]|tara:strand:- start:2829 stop:3767 length:939 start_codon:yes stop_codon:yes gene_type:complete